MGSGRYVGCGAARKLGVSRIRHNLSAETDTLSPSVYEPIAIKVLSGAGAPLTIMGKDTSG